MSSSPKVTILLQPLLAYNKYVKSFLTIQVHNTSINLHLNFHWV